MMGVEMCYDLISIPNASNTDTANIVIESNPLAILEEGPIDRSIYHNEDAIPYEGKEFLTHVEAYNYYNAFARMKGFGIRRESLDKSRKVSKVVLGRLFVCNKAGKKRLTDKRDVGKFVTRRPNTRVGCMAKMRIKLTSSNTWEVTTFVDKHNHDLASPDKVSNFYSQKPFHRSNAVKNLMISLNAKGMTPANTARVLNVGSQDELITAQQVVDHVRKIRSNNIGRECLSIIKNFQDRKEVDPDFFFAMEVDDDGTMRSVFWADGRSRSSYLRFGDIIVFDVTYKTNNWNLPFAPFTGVNHHRQSTLFGCALLADETEDSFVWLFTQWLKCMHGIEPKAIVTDQDAQIGKAIKKVFPNTRHRLCAWHIRKHIAEHLGSLQALYGEKFGDYFFRWVYGSTVDQCWDEMKIKFNILDEGGDWLHKMYRLREYWVDAYLKDIFWAGMTTSQRSESINAFFDSYVNSKTRISEFVLQYDNAIAARRASESKEDFMTLNTQPALCISHPIKVQAGELYTRTILKLFQIELTDSFLLFHEKVVKEASITIYKVGNYTEDKSKWNEVVFNQSGELKIICKCAMFETDGILCKHILKVMHHKQMQVIPDYYILPRWKIHARHRNIGFAIVMNMRNNNSEKQCDIIRQWVLRAKFNEALEMVCGSNPFLSKLENMLEEFMHNTEKDLKPQRISVDSDVDSNAPPSLSLSNIPEITIRDRTRPVDGKGRPRAASRHKSGLEISQKKKETEQRTCGNCGQKGHYRTSCPTRPVVCENQKLVVDYDEEKRATIAKLKAVIAEKQQQHTSSSTEHQQQQAAAAATKQRVAAAATTKQQQQRSVGGSNNN